MLLEVKLAVWRRNMQAGYSPLQHNCKKYQSSIRSYQFGEEVKTDLQDVLISTRLVNVVKGFARDSI